MNVRYTRRAFADREAIFAYLHERSPAAATAVVGLIATRIAGLATAPFKGRKTDRVGLYSLLIAPYPYRVFYRIEIDGVAILHIRHTARRPWSV